MMLRRLTGLLLLLSTLTGQAQSLTPNPDSLGYPSDRPRRWVVKFAPLSLFDPDNTIQVGAERLLSRQHTVQAEFGYGWQGLNLWQNSRSTRYRDREVWRGRVEYRYYFNRTGAPIGRYVAAEGFFKQVNARESGTAGIGCETGLCQYYRLFDEPVRKYVWGGHVKIGRQFALTPDDRLLMDFYAGLGFRRSRVERFALPTSQYYYESAGYTLFDAFSPRQYAVVSVAYGIKIGYSL